MRRSALDWLAIAYAVAGIAALLVIPASAYGLFGIEEDPLSAVFALLLGLPWSLALNLFSDAQPIALKWTVLVIGIGINFALLRMLARRRRRTAPTGGLP
jgi:hypothetical protein